MSLEDRDLNRVQTKTCERRREQAEKEWRRAPIDQYKDDVLSDLTRSDRKRRLRAIRRFETHLLEEIASEEDPIIVGVRDAVDQDGEHWRDEDLKPDPELSASTVAERLQFVKSFYQRLNTKNAYSGNPIRDALEEFRENHKEELDPDRPYIPYHRLKKFLNWLDTPFARVAWLLAFKVALRKGEFLNLDLRCLHIDHPVFWNIVEEHDVVLDTRVRDHPDTLYVYGHFNKETEVPNGDTPGWQGAGEVREAGNKRKQADGSLLPIDSELKTALIEWLLIRPPSYDAAVHPLVTMGAENVKRLTEQTAQSRLWSQDGHTDSIREWSAQESLDECPTCGNRVVEETLTNAEKTGRRYRCQKCNQNHWRTIHWETGAETEEKVTYHQGRHTFSSAHNPENSGLYDDAIADKVRKKHIRGDSNKQGDTEDQVYIEDQYADFEADVRQPYLDAIYKFDIYDDPIPAVGEGWDT